MIEKEKTINNQRMLTKSTTIAELHIRINNYPLIFAHDFETINDLKIKKKKIE